MTRCVYFLYSDGVADKYGQGGWYFKKFGILLLKLSRRPFRRKAGAIARRSYLNGK